MIEKSDKATNFFELTLFSKSRVQLLNLLVSNLDHSRSTAYIFTPNPEQAVLASQSPAFLEYLKQADILLPDGVGLIWASKILGHQTAFPDLRYRIPGREVVADLIALAEQRKLCILVLGGRDLAGKKVLSPAVTDVTITNAAFLNEKGSLKAKTPGVWWLEGYKSVDQPSDEEEQQVHQLITRLKPDIIFVAFGAPHQERWVIDHKTILEKSQVSIAMVVGGSFEVLTGTLVAPPAWISKLGVEWLFRLIQEPWRWKRQLALVAFVRMVLKRAILRPE